MKNALALLAAVAMTLAGAAHAVDVYKWTDSQGVVHYGDHPASGAAVSTVSVPGGEPSPRDVAAAQARLAADRAKLEQPTAGSSGDHSRASSAKPAESACATAWRQYDAAQACFDAHRAAGGKGINGAGGAACQELPQPSCTR
jgi:Domain of unknown function (DUF4124)